MYKKSGSIGHYDFKGRADFSVRSSLFGIRYLNRRTTEQGIWNIEQGTPKERNDKRPAFTKKTGRLSFRESGKFIDASKSGRA